MSIDKLVIKGKDYGKRLGILIDKPTTEEVIMKVNELITKFNTLNETGGEDKHTDFVPFDKEDVYKPEQSKAPDTFVGIATRCSDCGAVWDIGGGKDCPLCHPPQQEQSRGECPKCKAPFHLKGELEQMGCWKCGYEPQEVESRGECEDCKHLSNPDNVYPPRLCDKHKPQEVEPTEDWEEKLLDIWNQCFDTGGDTRYSYQLDKVTGFISSLLERKDREWREKIEKGKISKRNLKDGNDEYWNKGVKYYNKALSDLLEREEA